MEHHIIIMKEALYIYACDTQNIEYLFLLYFVYYQKIPSKKQHIRQLSADENINEGKMTFCFKTTDLVNRIEIVLEESELGADKYDGNYK